MKKIKRIIYLIYYLRNQNWKQYNQFLNYIGELKGKRKLLLVSNSVNDSLKYNITPVEYFQFGFYEKSITEKQSWVGTGTMYEFQLVMNPKSQREILDDKRKFYKVYKNFVVHKVASLQELKDNPSLISDFLNNKTEKLVFKASDGKCGFQVEMKNTKEFSETNLTTFMEKNEYDLLEEFIEQHPIMNKLSPSGVNTVRIITQLDKNNNVHLLGCRQRISVNSSVDNLASGNIVATIDETTGKIDSPAVYSDITKDDVTIHPVTGTKIIGFQIPYWSEVINMVKQAALLHPQNRSIGWDVVITDKGPGLIEGNHDWCKLVWQLPAKQGFKSILDGYLKEYLSI